MNTFQTLAQVKRILMRKDFTFLITAEGEEIFLHHSVLLAAGFSVADVTETSSLEVVAQESEKGPKVVEVISVDGVPASKSKKSSAPKAKKGPPIRLEQFFRVIPAGENKKTGEMLYRVMNLDDEFVQYLVADHTGLVLRQLGNVTSKAARVSVGLEPKSKQERLREEFVPGSAIAAE